MRLWSVAAVMALAAQAAWAAPGPGPGSGPGGATGPGVGAAMGGCPMMGGMMGMGGMAGRDGRQGRGGPGGMPGMGRAMGLPPVAPMLIMHRQMLGLTDAQVDRLRAIQESTLRQEIRTSADIRLAELDLRDLLMQPNPDRRKVEAAVRNVGRLGTDLQVAHANAILDALAVLTPQQRDQMMRMAREGMAGCPRCQQMMGGGAAMPPAGAPPSAPTPATTPPSMP